MMHILVVCTANICRSPTGEAVLRALITAAGLGSDVSVESAGTKAGSGRSPDVRSRLVAENNGYSLQGIRSRPLEMRDFRDFDLILGMDLRHCQDMRQDCPLEHMDKIKLFLDFTPGLVGTGVPDPYSGEASDFVTAFELIEQGAKGLIAAIQDQEPHLAYRDQG